jgi:plastocyanin
MHPRLLLLLALVAALAAGCGGDDEPASNEKPATTAPAGDTVAVTMKDTLFKPENVTVRSGQTVVWTNEDSIAHTVKAVAGASFESKSISEGETYKQKLTTVGGIDYLCTIHPSQKGSIDVEP